jgi:HEAT repeat protein
LIDRTENRQPATDVPRESAKAILFQFVIFPLGIVAVAVGIFLLFGQLASEQASIPEYLSDIRSGSSHRKFQAAYELSKSIKRGEAKRYPDLVNQVAAVYREAKDDDPRICQYLTLVLGKIGDRRATPTLIDALRDSNTDIRVYALLALSELRDPEAVPAMIEAARDREKDVRKTAVFALGQSGDARAIPALAAALNDQTADIRYNAALALARFDDRLAAGVLEEMLDRSRLDRVSGMRPDQKEEAMLAAIAAYAKVAGPDAKPLLERLAAADPSMRVRAAAKSAAAQ